MEPVPTTAAVHRVLVGLTALAAMASACSQGGTTSSDASVATTASSSTTTQPLESSSTSAAPTVTEPVTTSTSAPYVVERIGVRVVDGEGEFYNVATNERFVPRGVNYLEFREAGSAGTLDSVFSVGGFDAARVQEAFRTLAGFGYNTARIFYDVCDRGPRCLVGEDRGWNPHYVDNIAQTIGIAAQENIHVLLTANSIPVDSRWQDIYDELFGGGEMNGLISNLNGYWLHEAGFAAREQMFAELLEALDQRDVPFEAVLGWQLQNELWLDPTLEPLSLQEGVVESVTGTYDVSDPSQRRALVADAVTAFVDRMREVVDRHDPDGLITVGFFSPAVASDWAYVDTASFIDTADVDFWDFHAYHDTNETLREQAEAFGMLGFADKPIVMGETGGGKAIVPSALSNVGAAHRWMAEACELGFDGWLNWGYYPWPQEVGGAAWSMLDGDGLLLEWASPTRQPDMCVPPEDAPLDPARSATITASRSFEGNPPEAVVDGSVRAWNAGDAAPQWIELSFENPIAVAEIGLAVEQWPPGPTLHEISAQLEDGTRTVLANIERYTEPETLLSVTVTEDVGRISSIRITTLEGEAWTAWREISVTPAG